MTIAPKKHKRGSEASEGQGLALVEGAAFAKVAALIMVAKGGFEPPTQGFSVPCSTN